MPSTTVLITGTKAGLGKGLLEAYAALPNTTVIAAIRDGPDSSAAKPLQAIPKAEGSSIIVAEYDAGNTSSAVDLVASLREKHNISQLDIVIANAGILNHWGPVVDVKAEQLTEHFNINTVAPILLYRHTAHLLNKSFKPKFFIISSNLGSNGLMDNYASMQMLPYGLSKAAVNFAISRIHREEPKMTVVAVQPGWVQTTMGEKAAVWAGMKASDVPVTMEDSIAGMMKLFADANKEVHSGGFWNQEGKQNPW